MIFITQIHAHKNSIKQKKPPNNDFITLLIKKYSKNLPNKII